MKRTTEHTFPLVLKTLLVGAITCGAAVGPADADLARRTAQSTTQSGQAHSICESVVHLQPADALFKECTSSLEESLESASRARAISQARDACFASTSKLNDTNLNLCLLSVAEAKAGADDIQPLRTGRRAAKRNWSRRFPSIPRLPRPISSENSMRARRLASIPPL
jgi:hypothetical protein